MSSLLIFSHCKDFPQMHNSVIILFPSFHCSGSLNIPVEINVLTPLHHLFTRSHEINELFMQPESCSFPSKQVMSKDLSTMTEHISEFALLLFLQIYCAAFTTCTLLEEINQSVCKVESFVH